MTSTRVYPVEQSDTFELIVTKSGICWHADRDHSFSIAFIAGSEKGVFMCKRAYTIDPANENGRRHRQKPLH